MTYLLHAPVERRAFVQWASSRNVAPQGVVDDGLALHILLSALFGKGVLQPFRLFMPAQGEWSLYAYAAQPLEALLSLAETVAPPEMLAVLPLARWRAKAMPTSLAIGARLGFDLRARPVRRGAREWDAYQWEGETQHAGNPEGMAKAGRTRELVYRAWLQERFGDAATIETCRLTAFQRQRVWRNGQRLEGPDATLQGTLVLREEAEFLRLLAQGVGRHRAYGFGMLMLRPPDQPVPSR